MLLLLVTGVTAASWSMVSPILIIFLQDTLTLPTDQLAWAFLPSGLVWALLPARLGTLADRFGRKQLMVVGLIGAAAVSLLIPSLANWIMLALLWAALALFSAAGDPAEQALVAELTGADQRGRAYGVYALMGGLGATIGPFGGAWLYQMSRAERAVLCQWGHPRGLRRGIVGAAGGTGPTRPGRCEFHPGFGIEYNHSMRLVKMVLKYPMIRVHLR